MDPIQPFIPGNIPSARNSITRSRQLHILQPQRNPLHKLLRYMRQRAVRGGEDADLGRQATYGPPANF